MSYPDPRWYNSLEKTRSDVKDLTRLVLILVMLVAWTFTKDNGVQVWTDDQDHIPAKYADQAERVELGPLIDYPRLSVVDSEAEED